MSYDYSPYHRGLEILGIGAFFSYVVLMSRSALQAAALDWSQGAWLLPLAAITAYLAADLVSGFFHFLADNFCSEEMPILGASVIRPFREHHVDPRGMTRHDFIETNGNNCLICIPHMLATYYLVDATAGMLQLFWMAFFSVFVLAILGTNQFHKWSHLEDPPGWIRFLQRWRLILSPDHHDVHHTPPFDKYYCITTGWLNPILWKLKFFPIMQVILVFLGLPKAEEAKPLPAARPEQPVQPS